MKLTRILAIRHGETDWNASGRVQGHTDIALNATGLRQAQRLAQALADRAEDLQAIYSSDLRRALQTAQAIAQATGAPLHPHPGLRERHLGSLQGHSFAEASARWPEQAQAWRSRAPDWQPPGGESLRQLQARLRQTVDELAARHLGGHIALVTHGGVLDWLYRSATGLGLQDARTWQLPNAAINRLLWTPDTGLTLVGWADTTHLNNKESLDETTT